MMSEYYLTLPLWGVVFLFCGLEKSYLWTRKIRFPALSLSGNYQSTVSFFKVSAPMSPRARTCPLIVAGEGFESSYARGATILFYGLKKLLKMILSVWYRKTLLNLTVTLPLQAMANRFMLLLFHLARVRTWLENGALCECYLVYYPMGHVPQFCYPNVSWGSSIKIFSMCCYWLLVMSWEYEQGVTCYSNSEMFQLDRPHIGAMPTPNTPSEGPIPLADVLYYNSIITITC